VYTSKTILSLNSKSQSKLLPGVLIFSSCCFHSTPSRRKTTTSPIPRCDPATAFALDPCRTTRTCPFERRSRISSSARMNAKERVEDEYGQIRVTTALIDDEERLSRQGARLAIGIRMVDACGGGSMLCRFRGWCGCCINSSLGLTLSRASVLHSLPRSLKVAMTQKDAQILWVVS